MAESRSSPVRSKDVDAYIARRPRKMQAKLREVRKVIREVVPDATELISYSMPGYSYEGYSYKGMFAWFALQSNHIGLYLRPPTISDNKKGLAGYKVTKSAVHLPLDRKIPAPLIRKLVKYSARMMKERDR
ncbi:MAG: DUF1801 domain-containing protein [Candidatus Micrarchaeota archaeon]|nr:DUF1801 domain-containing protein [Candidatus Micrarchaeota archaeon]